MQFLHNLPVYEFSLGGLGTEFTVLALAVALGLFQLLVAARTGNGQRGLKWNVGARDEPPPPVGPVAGRLERAARNFMETFPFFATIVILLALTARHNWATVWGSEIYLATRIVYLPLYGFGVPGLRTLVWLVSLLAILLLLGALFFPAL
ncbi:MAG: MAPEG family protein [Rhizomicrobium sp.]